MSEQWKSGGDCEVCRRRDYCRKTCSEYHRLRNRLNNQIAEGILAFSALIGSASNNRKKKTEGKTNETNSV